MNPNEQFESTLVHWQEKSSNPLVNKHFESGLILSWTYLKGASTLLTSNLLLQAT